MKNIEIQEAFELELNAFTDINKPTSNDTEYWINNGILKFVKTRFTGNNYSRTSVEQTQKRIDDLRTLTTTAILPVREDNDQYYAELPEDYMYLLGDRVGILPVGQNDQCWKKDSNGEYIVRFTDTLEAKIETLDRQLSNSLSEHNLHYCAARPLKLIEGNNINFYTDGKYYVSMYYITYLRKPDKFSLNEPYEQYDCLTDEALQECIKLAVQMYIENKGSERYNTISNEITTME